MKPERSNYNPIFNLKVGIVQRVITDYRKPFFERMARRKGITLSVFAGNSSSNEAVQEITSLESIKIFYTKNCYFKTKAGYLCWQKNILTWLRVFRPHILVLEANSRLLSNWLAIWQMRALRKPVIGWGLGEISKNGVEGLNKFRFWYKKKFFCAFDSIISYSSKAADDYFKYGQPKGNIFIAHNATDDIKSEEYLLRLKKSVDWVKVWRETIGIPEGLPIVLFVGRLIPEKQVEILIEACSSLVDRCELLIVGDGPKRPELEKLNIHVQNAHFVGYKSGEDLARCFIASDLFVLPGSGGLAIHQAMSYGKPVVVSFGDGTERDLVREGINGRYFRSGDVNHLKFLITDLLSDREKLKLMGNASTRIIDNERGINSMQESFLTALIKTIEKFGST